jgi:hypothetical protein
MLVDQTNRGWRDCFFVFSTSELNVARNARPAWLVRGENRAFFMTAFGKRECEIVVSAWGRLASEARKIVPWVSTRFTLQSAMMVLLLKILLAVATGFAMWALL